MEYPSTERETSLLHQLRQAQEVSLLLAEKLAETGCDHAHQPQICGRCSGLCHLKAALERVALPFQNWPRCSEWRESVFEHLAAVGRVFQPLPAGALTSGSSREYVYQLLREDERDMRIFFGFSHKEAEKIAVVDVWEQYPNMDYTQFQVNFVLKRRMSDFLAAHEIHNIITGLLG
jgi:hypothetical protein